MALLVVYNPVCGNSSGKDIVDTHVLPLLVAQGRHPDKVAETEHPGHAGTIVLANGPRIRVVDTFAQITSSSSESAVLIVSDHEPLYT